MIYLDNNATSRPAPEVVSSMIRALEQDWANPSSMHWYGQLAAKAVAYAREQVAQIVGVSASRIVFTSGATEANEAVLRHYMGKGFSLVTSSAEHPATTAFYTLHAPDRIKIIPLDQQGCWRIDVLEKVLGALSGQSLIAFSWANGETGVIQDVEAICEFARHHRAKCLIDASQAIGRIPIDSQDIVDSFITFSGHKINGPKGVGVLVNNCPSEALVLSVGGGQEGSLRGGTENVPGIVGIGVACELRYKSFGNSISHMSKLRDKFETYVTNRLPDVRLNGARTARIPNTSNMTFPGIDGMAIMANLEGQGVICSQVSACSSARPEPSRTLLAMGLSNDDAFASVRFSVSTDNTEDEIEVAAQVVVEEVSKLRKLIGGLV